MMLGVRNPAQTPSHRGRRPLRQLGLYGPAVAPDIKGRASGVRQPLPRIDWVADERATVALRHPLAFLILTKGVRRNMAQHLGCSNGRGGHRAKLRAGGSERVVAAWRTFRTLPESLDRPSGIGGGAIDYKLSSQFMALLARVESFTRSPPHQ